MTFKNINAVFSFFFYQFDVFLFHLEFPRIQYALLDVLFQFFSFPNSFKYFSTAS